MKSKYRILEKINATLLNYIIMLVGIVFITISIIIGIDNTIGLIFNSIGTSMLASAIVVFISSKYLIKNNEIKKIIEKWGLTDIFKTRAEMNKYTNQDLKENKNKLDIIAFGLKAFRQSKSELIISKVKEGMKIRILTIDPNSKFLKERERVEECSEGEIKNTIEQLNIWVNELKDHQQKENQVVIKYYDSLPLDFYFALDNSVYIGPYIYGKSSQQTISYSFKSNSDAYHYYEQYFEKLWEDTKFCKKKEEKEK